MVRDQDHGFPMDFSSVKNERKFLHQKMIRHFRNLEVDAGIDFCRQKGEAGRPGNSTVKSTKDRWLAGFYSPEKYGCF